MSEKQEMIKKLLEMQKKFIEYDHKHGVSMEEEVRRILTEAVSAPERLGDLAVRMFGPTHGVDLELPDRGPHEPVDVFE